MSKPNYIWRKLTLSQQQELMAGGGSADYLGTDHLTGRARKRVTTSLLLVMSTGIT
jgi:hypothetical protein